MCFLPLLSMGFLSCFFSPLGGFVCYWFFSWSELFLYGLLERLFLVGEGLV